MSESASMTFPSLNPGTGEEIARYPSMDAEQVQALVDRARIAQAWWADQGFAGRRRRLTEWKNTLVRRMDELADLVHQENGKPREDALLEILLSIEHIDWAARNAARTLDSRSVRSGLLSINQSGSLGYEPLGVIGVIGPWNYPVFTPLGSIAYALAAGNAVVFKPSEWTTAIGAWIVNSFADVVPEQPVLLLATGSGEAGAALCTSGVDKISFTGSTPTGRRVMAACATRLTPVVLELGGKDALIVDVGADIDAAARAAAFGGLSNGGQTCVGVERVYVVDSLYDAFVKRLGEIAQGLRPGTEDGSSYGPMTMPNGADKVREHVRDALASGGQLVVGSPDAMGGRVIPPTVITGVPDSSESMLEETFGPVILVNRVRDLDEAVDRANATEYGLAASLFGGDRRALVAAARRLRVGMVSIGSWVMYAGVPALPWGGVGQSGFGRIHGADGLREFSRAKSVVRQRFDLPLELTRFDRNPRTIAAVKTLVRLRHGRF